MKLAETAQGGPMLMAGDNPRCSQRNSVLLSCRWRSQPVANSCKLRAG
jgi:hypothetical protein